MKRNRIILGLIIAIVIGCLSPFTAEAKKRKVNLDTYIYAASFTDDLRYRNDWNFRNAEATIFEAIGKSGLELIENTEIAKLNDMLKQALLLVRVNIYQREDGGNVSVDMIDYKSQKPVKTYRGSYYTALGGAGGDLDSAVQSIIKQINKDFPVSVRDNSTQAPREVKR